MNCEVCRAILSAQILSNAAKLDHASVEIVTQDILQARVFQSEKRDVLQLSSTLPDLILLS